MYINRKITWVKISYSQISMILLK